MSFVRRSLCMAALSLLAAGPAAAQRPFITLATASAPHESGLLAAVLPKFTADTGIEVKVLAVGTGAAFALGKRGGADVLLVDDRDSADLFVRDRHALERREVMRNEYLIVGHASDPAGVRDVTLATAAFTRFSDTQTPFVSPGDESGAHKAEQRRWARAGRVPSAGAGVWYFTASGGTEPALALAAEKRAYTIVDRASWLAMPNRRGLVERLSGDPALRSSYAVLVVNDLKHKGVKFALGKKLADWLTGYQGRTAITAFRLADRQVFYVD